jgi:hypothetical protein
VRQVKKEIIPESPHDLDALCGTCAHFFHHSRSFFLTIGSHRGEVVVTGDGPITMTCLARPERLRVQTWLLHEGF